MKNISGLFVLVVFLILSGCYAGINGKVIDAETQKPIEGAIVLVEWTKTHGYGFTSTDLYQKQEGVTDSEGKIHLNGVNSISVNPPRLTVYKKGYVAWNSVFIFPGWAKRSDFNWVDGFVIILLPFKSDYSLSDHVFFLQSITHWGVLIEKAYRWEVIEKEKNK